MWIDIKWLLLVSHPRVSVRIHLTEVVNPKSYIQLIRINMWIHLYLILKPRNVISQVSNSETSSGVRYSKQLPVLYRLNSLASGVITIIPNTYESDNQNSSYTCLLTFQFPGVLLNQDSSAWELFPWSLTAVRKVYCFFPILPNKILLF